MKESSLLERVCKTRDETKFKKIVKKANEGEMKDFVLGLTNILKKKVPVSKRCAKMITKNRRVFRHLVHPQFSWKSKRRYLMQHGGGKFSALARLGSILLKSADKASPILRRASNVTRVATSPAVTRRASAAAAKEAAQTLGSRGSLSLLQQAPNQHSKEVFTEFRNEFQMQPMLLGSHRLELSQKRS